MQWQKQQEEFEIAEYFHCEYRGELTTNILRHVIKRSRGFQWDWVVSTSLTHLVTSILSIQTIWQQNNVHAHEVHTSNYSQVTGSLISSTAGENLEKSRGKGFVPNTKIEKTEVLGVEFWLIRKGLKWSCTLESFWGFYLPLSRRLYKQWIKFLHACCFSPSVPISNTASQEALSLERAEMYSLMALCKGYRMQ